MATIDENTKHSLEHLEGQLNLLLDHVIQYRDLQQSGFAKTRYRKIGNRVQKALTDIGDALELCQ